MVDDASTDGTVAVTRDEFTKQRLPAVARGARTVVLSEKKIILPEHLPETMGAKTGSRRIDDLFEGFSVKQAQKIMEKRLISRALDATGGNRTKASRLLEISHPSLLSKMKLYEIDK